MIGIGRAMSVLRLVAGAPGLGLRSADISLSLGLHKASTSRLLAALVRLGALERDRGRRYRIAEGFRAEFGMPISAVRLRQAARLSLGSITNQLEDTAFLSVRSGLDSLCVERHVGTYPIQALSLSVGGRRPLGVGAGSMALIAWLPSEEREATIAMQAGRLDRFAKIDTPRIAALAAQAREQGFTKMPGLVVHGLTGMGVPVRDPSGLVIGALSVAAIADRLSSGRDELAVRTLFQAAAAVEARLRTGEVTGRDPSGHDPGGLAER